MKHYTYQHKTLCGKVFYIGVGTILSNNTKDRSRFSRAYHESNRNKFWKSVRDKYGLVPGML